ncbi:MULTISPECIES: aminotransferase class III-fold pyridoxal phosphate-dependent enzyme [unclassified Thermosipho (in: thermotogales)]|uniref:aspartate aminotransferase family protein n=1 Tax=unclassified Thermosipho (in: thermotogales) TaxID=2676525 RepID=UPI00098682DE|nr:MULTISPECIES: aminotransferase class III-fold pyridoxal phosphate-dependent enzyme [unclassified Thermosipho (in: thermotogales)]MBT1248435.1 aminotransferase class III [Thermosipho sp. 1244]OOC47562.1 aminotransferase class III [Thermosipho sp. 1223]
MFISNTYNRFPIKIKKADGIWIFDDKGNKYLDTFSGIGVTSFGHCNEEISNAIIEKLQKYSHISNFFLDEDAIEVSERLVKETGKNGKVYFSNSGTEANEAALKAIKKTKKGAIISFFGNFHGRTIGSLSITGFPNIRSKFLPLLNNVIFLPFNDIKSFKDVFKNQEVSAVFVESIRGSGGLDTLTKEFADTIMEYKEKFDFILVTDEVQSGLGKTGEFFSYKHFNLEPDIITVAKSLGGGLPLGATIFTGKFSDIFSPGDHGSTFAPNPLALAASKVVLKKINQNLLLSIKEKGLYLKKHLLNIKNINKVKGLGLMLGVTVDIKGDILKLALKENLLLNVVKNDTIRLLPPLNIKYEEIDLIVSKLKKALTSR